LYLSSATTISCAGGDFAQLIRSFYMNESNQKSFTCIDKMTKINGNIQLRYGEKKDDPIPFILIVTPPYVANKIGKSPAKYAEVLKYVEAHTEELRQVALNHRDRGYTTAVLS
jgi:hypothetical protein